MPILHVIIVGRELQHYLGISYLKFSGQNFKIFSKSPNIYR